MRKLYSKPKLPVSLVFILMLSLFICLTVYLGMWQLDRAKYKKYLLDKITQQNSAPAVSISNFINTNYPQNRFMQVNIMGNPLNYQNILLDNQINYKKQSGYKIITPIRLSENPEIIILLDRGFIPRTKSKQELPTIAPLSDPIVILSGIINNPSTGILLQQEDYAKNTQWPLLVQSIDFKQLRKIFGNNLCLFIVQENNSNNDSMQQIMGNYIKDSHKHTSYACQWFVFAILGLCYFLYQIVKTNQQKKSRHFTLYGYF